jgi:hypothetical protein
VVVHVMVMPMVMMVVVVVMVMHRLGHRGRGGRRRSSFLRDGVSGEAERKHGRGGKGLDHDGTILWLGTLKRVRVER